MNLNDENLFFNAVSYELLRQFQDNINYLHKNNLLKFRNIFNVI